jgi:DNA primase small subunit
MQVEENRRGTPIESQQFQGKGSNFPLRICYSFTRDAWISWCLTCCFCGGRAGVKRPVGLSEFSFEDDYDLMLEHYYRTYAHYQIEGRSSRRFIASLAGRLFPFETFYRWLSYGTDKNDDGSSSVSKYFNCREFSFTLAGDIYIRYQSFATAEAFRKAVVDKKPHKIDIGAVFSLPPKDKGAVAAEKFIAKEKELVFDIDMTDYDEVRTCCSGADVCKKCWTFMRVAIEVLHHILTQTFGFKHLLFVYSGRRGIHCWVCDERARKMVNEIRSSVATYMHVIRGGDQVAQKCSLGVEVPPDFQEVFDTVCKPVFLREILPQQDILADAHCQKVLQMIPNEDVQRQCLEAFKKVRSSTERWKELVRLVESSNDRSFNMKRAISGIIYTYTYPRLDINVSTHVNHLLKSPFVVHPKTGRVCVPIDPAHCAEFDPASVPRAADLLSQIDSYSGTAPAGTSAISDLDKTQLRDYWSIFSTFLGNLEKERRKLKLKEIHSKEGPLAF